MKKYLSGLGIASIMLMCACNPCEAAESDVSAGQMVTNTAEADASGTAASDQVGIVPVAAELHDVNNSVAPAQASEQVISPLRVIIQGSGDTEAQAVALAKKKAVTRAIQNLQEENAGQEYKAEVFSLSYEYDRFVLAYNVRIKEKAADNISVEVRVDINRKALAEAMEKYK
ncbi:MAG: hypothetical protein ACI3U2_02130 [Anaerovibrio sp.]